MHTVQPDSVWTPCNTDPAFIEALDGTASIWVALLKRSFAEPQRAGLRLAYDRAVLALAQLPIEYAGPETRFNRCRWRAAGVQPGKNPDVHCEHPWTKKRTKTMIWEAAMAALSRGVPDQDIVAAVAALLAARQDTVLLPHKKLTQMGVLSERHHDGLAARYTGAISAGKLELTDRLTGKRLTKDDILEIERISFAQVEASIKALAGDADGWSPELHGSVGSDPGTVSAPKSPSNNAGVENVYGWLRNRLGPETVFESKKNYMAIKPAQRKFRGALEGFDGRGTPVLIFRSGDRDRWVNALRSAGWNARAGDGDRLHIRLPPGSTFDTLNEALESWR